jgi:hypothetical protein
MGHEVLVAQAVGQLAMVDVLEGRFDDAQARLCTQLDTLRRTHNLEGLANALDTAAALAVAREHWRTAARVTTVAAALRDRIRMAPWPFIREYHQASGDAARRRLGNRFVALEADAARVDPWTAVEDALTDLRASAA